MLRDGGDLLSGGLTDTLDPQSEDLREQQLIDSWITIQENLFRDPVRASRWLLEARGDPAQVVARLGGTAKHRGVARCMTTRRHLARVGARVVPHTALAYPPSLRCITDPSPVLLVRGDVSLLRRPAVAIVGARAATRYGLDIARKLGEGLARQGVVVVSGLARGIDAAAHRGALEAGGPTVAVLACGLDVVYPPEHVELADKIAGSGAIVTEFPLGQKPLRLHFPLRNRLISGLSRGVIVVEARERSGSLITARHALDQGREVLAVPGPVTSPASAGPNALLRDGASPLLELRDAFETLGLSGSDVLLKGPEPIGDDSELTPEAIHLLELIRASPSTRAELADHFHRTPREVSMLLLSLELAGQVVVDRDGRARAILADGI